MSEPVTKSIRDLVVRVLDGDVPRTEHVIDDVLFTIERNRRLRAEYDGLCEQFGPALVNQMIGRWTKSVLGWATKGEVDSKKNNLSKNYSILMPSTRKLTEDERRTQAGNEVFAFFSLYRGILNRGSLSAHRDELEGRVLNGMPVEEAFFAVMAANGMDTRPLQEAIAANTLGAG